jgi:hypothetical protein
MSIITEEQAPLWTEEKKIGEEISSPLLKNVA